MLNLGLSDELHWREGKAGMGRGPALTDCFPEFWMRFLLGPKKHKHRALYQGFPHCTSCEPHNTLGRGATWTRATVPRTPSIIENFKG